MKKLTILMFVMLSVTLADAQTRTDSIQVAYDKIANLENRLTLQDTRIAQLLQQVDEVTRQNLALKKNLNLSPTVATAKAGDIMEYSIKEVTGDTATNTVHMVMIADNVSDQEKYIMYPYYQIIDDLGHGYENSLIDTRVIFTIEGVSEQVLGHGVQHPVSAPYTIDIYLNGVVPEVQYVKYLSFEITDQGKHYKVIFENLPIKWNK